MTPALDTALSTVRTLTPRYGWTVFAALIVIASSTFAAAVHQIAQKGRSFSAAEVTIAAGESIRFTNEDEFLHQIYVDSPNLNFDSDEQRPGETIEVRFPNRGTFPVRCHIHPKMLLTVHVR